LRLPDDLAEPLAAAGDRVGAFGGRVHWFDEVTSTNDVAARLAEQGAGEGTIVIADAQSAGRGRMGRTWVSPSGAGLYVSVVLRPASAWAPLVTVGAGVAIAEGIAEATGLDPALKWPNDLYVSDRKLGGILAEAGSSGGHVEHVVLGFGVNLMGAAYPPDIAARATSLEEELGRPIDRGTLLVACLAALARRVADLRGGRSREVLEAWRRRARPSFGRRVEWGTGAEVHRGVAEDLDGSGALVVRTERGTVRVISGEVRWT
jgi:BirA family biotin operon repressor/biotin-[acetyl-CoA-carboxylase] ligase